MASGMTDKRMPRTPASSEARKAKAEIDGVGECDR
jgi:hypothetical protein